MKSIIFISAIIIADSVNPNYFKEPFNAKFSAFLLIFIVALEIFQYFIKIKNEKDSKTDS